MTESSSSNVHRPPTFWQHMFGGWLILLVPFFGLFAISAFTPWDGFDSIIGSDYWLYGVPLFGLVWIAVFFWKNRAS
jgi:hypothetical protein